MAAGIYRILNKENHKFYIGSSVNLDGRWKEHKARLNSGKHTNQHLCKAWFKYGPQAFEFEILELTLKENLKNIEQFYLDKWVGLKECYNICKDSRAPTRGRKYSREHKQKIAKSLQGHVVSEETKSRISKSNQGRILTLENCKNMSQARKPEGWPPLQDPNGIVYFIEQGIPKFCKDHNLNTRALQRVLKKYKGFKSHKGFKLILENKEVI